MSRYGAGRLLVVVLVAALASGALARAARQVDPEGTGAGCLTVHVGPRVKSGAPASYFQLTVAPGRLEQEALLIANPQPYSCRVILAAAYGKTATNSGDTYPPIPSGGCVRTSCWLSGLPGKVTVPARSRVVVPFDVRVPVGTPGGEYLAGVLVRPDIRPATAASRPGRPGVGAVIMTSVGVGVAVRVPGPLRPAVTISSVTLNTDSGTPLIQIVEQNRGNTWEHPVGGVEIVGGAGARATRLGVSSSTVLAGDSATLTLPVGGTNHGTHAVRVVLWYAGKKSKAVWEGSLSFPVSKPPPGPHTTNQVVITTSRIPAWVIGIAVGLGVGVLLLALVLGFLLRRRRRDEPGEDAPVPEPAPDPAPVAAPAQALLEPDTEELAGVRRLVCIRDGRLVEQVERVETGSRN